MKGIKTGLFVLMICFMVITLYKVNGKASGPMDGQIIDGSVLTSDSEATDERPLLPDNVDESEAVPYGNYLSNGTAAISNKGNGIVYIAGDTYCYKTCDQVKVNLYLQKLSGGSWYTIQSQPHIEYNTYVASNGIYFSVEKGYYYRVRGGHSAKKGSTTESTTTCTNGIYVN